MGYIRSVELWQWLKVHIIHIAVYGEIQSSFENALLWATFQVVPNLNVPCPSILPKALLPLSLLVID